MRNHTFEKNWTPNPSKPALAGACLAGIWTPNLVQCTVSTRRPSVTKTNVHFQLAALQPATLQPAALQPAPMQTPDAEGFGGIGREPLN
jgi:hypothetical protein